MDVVADGSVRWLSYAGLAEALANRESARQLTLRKCWGRHKDNDERARVSVPVSALPDPSAGTSARTSSRTDGRRSVGADGEASALQVKLGELEAALRVKLAELEGERQRCDELLLRCDELLLRCDELRGERADRRAQALTLPSSSRWRWSWTWQRRR